jgi:dihydropteroate synthase
VSAIYERTPWTPYRRHWRLPSGKTLELGHRTLIMGILNVTPDSFSDGGRYLAVDAAVAHAKRMVEEGADVIDVGGESTRPGSRPVSAEEEMARVLPVIERLSREVDVPISIDTYKAEVARRAVAAGADIVNDVWGFKKDPDMAAAVAHLQCPAVLMHNRSEPVYRDFVREVLEDLLECVKLAREAGVPEDLLMLDPGIGFGKTYAHNVELMGRLTDIVRLGFPVLLGTSRKSMIRLTLDLPADDVVEGTGATVAFGIAQGCQIVRVHDVKEMKRVAVMTDAMVYGPGQTA